MSTVFVIACEGVLSAPQIELPSANPILDGVRLYEALTHLSRASVVLTEADSGKTCADWMKDYSISSPVAVVPGCTSASIKIAALRDHLGKDGARCQLYVDSDPDAVHMAVGLGMPAILFCHPKDTYYDWRPSTRQTWADRVGEIFDAAEEARSYDEEEEE